MSDRAEFLKRYAADILGRALSDDEADLVSQETNRRVVRDLCGTFLEKKVSTPKPKAKAKAKVTPIKELESVVDEEIESSSSKSTE